MKTSMAPRLEVRLDQLGQLAGLRDVGLVEHDETGALGERPPAEVRIGNVEGQLALDDVEVGHRVTARLEGGAVDDVDQHGAPLDVPEELEPEALALVCAGDEPRHVCHGERGSTRR